MMLTCLFAALEAFQLAVLHTIVFPFPDIANEVTKNILSEWKFMSHPNHDLFYFRFFIICSFVFWGISRLYISNKFKESTFIKFKRFLFVDSLGTIILALFVYQALVGSNFYSYRKELITILCVLWFFKATWVFIDNPLSVFLKQVHNFANTRFFGILIDAFVIATIPLLIWIPEISGAVAKSFQGELFYHLDGVIMAPGFAASKGLILNVDVISQYGIGWPIVLSKLSQLIGGWSYENILIIQMTSGIIYFIFLYVVLRNLTKSQFWSILGLFISIFTQMFHDGSQPFIWNFPNASIMRYFFDVPMIYLIYRFSRFPNIKDLFIASGICGFALFYVSDTGLYLWMAFSFSVLIFFWKTYPENLLSKNKTQESLILILAVIFPFILSFVLMWIVTGGHIWSSDFWLKTLEPMKIFVDGFGTIPSKYHFENKENLVILSALIVLLGYLFTILAIFNKSFKRKDEGIKLCPIFISVYGLCLYQRFVSRSTWGDLCAALIPAIILTVYWLSIIDLKFIFSYKKVVKNLVFGGVLGVLFLNPTYAVYPNLFNNESNMMVEAKDFLAKNRPSKKDLDLIQGLTNQNQPVCLISSNEVWILMQSDRKPFFYYFPLLNSRNIHLLDFGGTYLFTKSRLDYTIKQMQIDKPERIFIEKKYILGKLPNVYYQHYTAFAVLIDFLIHNYKIEREGEFLVSMKLN